MNYQLEVREKIESYPLRELIIANKFLKDKLPYVPANTYYKNIERMSKKGELERLAKGVYCRPKVTRFGKISAGEENILNYYIGKENYTGVVIGYRLYNKYGITTQVSKSVKIYSNVLEEEKKVIKNVEIKKINISIDSKIKRAVEQLEILENYDEIEDIDKNSLIRLYRTIAYLESILNKRRVENTLSQFLNKTSKYKIPAVEDFYEPAY